MEKPLHVFAGDDSADVAGDADCAVEAAVETASAEYLGRWHRLVSTTNWQKGRIICEWRAQLAAAGASPQACSDEAWSRRVGSVSPQHVGRLRRVYQRFGEIHEQFAGLYWSHFQAALDWHDAEMWLEGAVHSAWSVARMRTERWQALGAPPDRKPREEEIVAAELDEDVDPANDSPVDRLGPSLQEVHDPGREPPAEPDVWDAEEAGLAGEAALPSEAVAESIRPFENLPALPKDLSEAFEGFKLAILNHKLAGWREVGAADVLTVLDALKQLVLARS